MRNLQNRSDDYAAQAMRELNLDTDPPPDQAAAEYERIERAIAQAFRDGSMAELGDAPLVSPREVARKVGRR